MLAAGAAPRDAAVQIILFPRRPLLPLGTCSFFIRTSLYIKSIPPLCSAGLLSSSATIIFSYTTPATSSSSSQLNSIFLSQHSSSSLPNAVIVIYFTKKSYMHGLLNEVYSQIGANLRAESNGSN